MIISRSRCLRCQRNQNKCSMERPACERCREAHAKCIYDAPEAKRPRPKSKDSNSQQNFVTKMSQHPFYCSKMKSVRLPDPHLLDAIHLACSRHNVDPCDPEEAKRRCYSMDGSALLAFGILIEELVGTQLEQLNDYLRYLENRK